MASTDALNLPLKGVAFRMPFGPFYDNAGNRITGWSSPTATISKDAGTPAATTNTPVEIGSSGQGYLDLTSTEETCDSFWILGSISNSNAQKFDYYSATQRAGKYLFTNLSEILGTAVSTPATAGIMDTNVKNINNVAAATPGATGGILIAGTNAATTFATFTVSGAVAFQSTFAVTGTTTLTGAVSLVSTLGITGAVTLSSTLAVGNTTLNALTVTNNLLVSGTTTLTGNVSLGGTLGVTGTSTFAAINTGTIATTGNRTVSGAFTVSGTTTLTLAAGTITAASIAAGALVAAVWDGTISGHTTSGTFGGALNAASSAGDPWATVLPGAYGAGTAGFIVGTNLDDPISGVLTAIGALSVPTAIQNADALLKRDWTSVSGEASYSTLNALRFLRDKWVVSGTGLTVFKEDGSTTAWTGTVSVDPSAEPIVGNAPA